MDRNSIERERRLNMRNLLSRLFPLLPPQPTEMSIPDMVELATIYVKQLQRQLEEIKKRKMQLEGESEAVCRVTRKTISPVLDIIDSNSTTRVNLITGSNMKFTLSEIISVIEEEGAAVIGVTYNNAGETMNILSVHCQAICSRIGNESSRLGERLKTLLEECM
ncbi:transcription factor bHLH162-like [Herrania umbratica]|uniref:Transcription factor bHLH162-like n=1 Tax=Herrania umbratica TaxID=108875 RepID=A0A6J1B950_9ROSI|nr:transcription factor bHLH162-like [Herrania umbratica]